MSNTSPDISDPGRPGNPAEEDDDDASSDSSGLSSDPTERLPQTEENPSFESTWTLRISCPGQDPLELDDEDPEPAEYILHVPHLAPCLPNKQTAERLLTDILLGVPSLPPLPETVCPTRIVNAQVDLLAEMMAGPEDVITITPSFNDPKDAFPLDVIPRVNTPATDCSCRVDQLDFDGAWFEVPSSGLDLSTDFQEVLNEVLHGPSRLLGRRLTVMLRDVHFWIDRGLPFMARYITDHSKWIQALGCRAIPASAPDPSPTSNSNSTTSSTVTIWPAGALDERPAALVPRVLTVGHGFVLWATPVSGSPAQQWTVDVAGPGTTLVIPFERRIVMFHLTDSALIETEVCHYQLADPLRRVLSRREDESGPNAFMSDETTSELFLAIEKMTESVQLEDRIADYTFTRKTLLEVCDSARKLAARSQKRRFIAQKEKLTVALEQKRSGLKGVS
ncbi:hypothetical protein FFLO_06482 [Filobasidium floriforme]|uniref:Uncharacterized protein n=1 Tax=Filobasidium floriforme TaxID=5210 RepID=A0A8K0JF37_9TREE|nr:uncharacterized protein HD553DRAFT_320709 [Filobasidium floriforme]KAG7527965.1 hypothetical protein FFLO_06482 [Filobasidium floriforme]KAH8077664.1 hypothetical protein HD553DRAFT_320709 [Filobasidium floriforme]